MINPKVINISDYDYNLPDERIAKFPLPVRDSSKLLVWKSGQIEESVFRNVTDFIPEGSLLVFNNTKVIQARLLFQKPSGAKIEIFCLEPHSPTDYQQVFTQTDSCSWQCLVGNSKRWKDGCLSLEIDDDKNTVLTAERLESQCETSIIRFSWNNPNLSFADILDSCGELPIPPYLNRRTEESDKTTYQTVYSRIKGSVAAPTAGLHFTKDVLASLNKKNIDSEELTLHVGAGTFKPVKSETLAGHEMHAELFSVKRETIEKLLKHRGNVFAVGTTSVRTLESLWYIGCYLLQHPDTKPDNIFVNQWSPYQNESKNTVEHSKNEEYAYILSAILSWMDKNQLDSISAHTQIIIAPGYDFKIVNGMITNFHQPKSTLLLLVSAFVGGRWREIYDYAFEHNFRFLSYGDSSLLIQ
jgi:S-adenosylmethionine:tRNA ribosyltransferase-isomerase